MGSGIRLDKSNKQRGAERWSMKRAIEQYTKEHKTTVTAVLAERAAEGRKRALQLKGEHRARQIMRHGDLK